MLASFVFLFNTCFLTLKDNVQAFLQSGACAKDNNRL